MLNAHSDWPTRRASCTAAAAADAGASSVGVARRGSQRVLSPSPPASARLAIFLAPWSRSRCSLLTTADVASHECICAHGAPHPLMHHCSMTLQCCVTYLISSMVVGKGTATARGTTSKWRMASRAQKHTYTHTLSLSPHHLLLYAINISYAFAPERRCQRFMSDDDVGVDQSC